MSPRDAWPVNRMHPNPLNSLRTVRRSSFNGPTLDDDDDLDDSAHVTAIAVAAYVKNLQVLKRLKPAGERDVVDKLLTPTPLPKLTLSGSRAK